MNEHEAKVWIALIVWLALLLMTVTAGCTIYQTVTRYHVKPAMETRWTFPHDPGN